LQSAQFVDNEWITEAILNIPPEKEEISAILSFFFFLFISPASEHPKVKAFKDHDARNLIYGNDSS